MKRAVSISLGSSTRDKRVEVNFKGQVILTERIGTDGDFEIARQLFRDLDGRVDAFGVGGVDLYLRLDDREYPLRAALKLVSEVKHTPVVDGRGLKHTLERRVFSLAEPFLNEIPKFRQAFVPVAVDRLGLAQAVDSVSDRIVLGDLMIALGIPIPIKGIQAYKRVARVLLPLVSYFPMSMLFYGSGRTHNSPRCKGIFEDSDLLAGDFLYMLKYMPPDLSGKTLITNTTTEENVNLLRKKGIKRLITTTPRFEGRSFGTNMMEASLTAYAGLGRPLTDDELNSLIDDLNLRPSVIDFNNYQGP
jgi:hypothetical protein